MNSPAFITDIRTLEQRYPSNQKLSLNNLLVLLDRLGCPHLRLPPVIHLAGTNGKGSTQAFLKSILSAAGHRVHAYTSPHLIDFTERIVLNNQQITEQQFTDYLHHTLAVLGDAAISWFELVTAIAFQAFADVPADVVLLETGLGGRLDATNFINQPACSIITAISYDHQNVLGFSLAEIAAEKAGIIKHGVPVITCQQSPEVHRVIAERTGYMNSKLFTQTVDWDYEIDLQSSLYPFVYNFANQTNQYVAPALSGHHQFQNAGLALTALNVLKPVLPVELSAINVGLSQVQWPARLQDLHDHPWRKLLTSDTRLYLDGAHNRAGIDTLISFIKDHCNNQSPRPTIIFGALQRKELADLLSPLQDHVEQIISVPIASEDAHKPENIVKAAQSLGIAAHTASSVPVALEMLGLQQTCPNVVIICGSLYLAGEVLSACDK